MPLLPIIGPLPGRGPPILSQPAFAPASVVDAGLYIPRPLLMTIGPLGQGAPLIIQQTSPNVFPPAGNDRFQDAMITHPLLKFLIGRGKGPVMKTTQAQPQTDISAGNRDVIPVINTMNAGVIGR